MPIKSLDIRRLRAAQMIQAKILGTSHKDLAKQFNVAEETIERELSWARKQGLIQKHEDDIMANLVPDAIAAVKVALSNNDSAVALEILKGMNILKKPAAAAPPPPEDSDSLEVYMRVRKSKDANLPPASGQTSVDSRSLPAALPLDALDDSVREAILIPSDSEEGG